MLLDRSGVMDDSQVSLIMEKWCKFLEFGDLTMSFFITKHRGGKSADLDASLNQIGCTGRKSLVVGLDVRADGGAPGGATGGDPHLCWEGLHVVPAAETCM